MPNLLSTEKYSSNHFFMKLAFQSCKKKVWTELFVQLRTAVTAVTRKLYNFIFLSFTLFDELNKFWHNGPNIFNLIWVCLGRIYETESYHLTHVCHTIAVSCQGTVVRALDYECKGPDSKNHKVVPRMSQCFILP